MNHRYIYADPHYYHTNVIEYSNRPFNSMEQMNKEMIKRHNSIVKTGDKVFILGDFALSNKEKTSYIVSRLNGNLVLIMGNHCRGRNKMWWLDAGFKDVSSYPILINENVILSHEPVENVVAPFFNIHGHIHEKNSPTNRHYNVCVEQTDYYPLNLDILLQKI